MERGGTGEVFGAFLRLGLTAFGGPIAHLGYFRQEFVARRGWLDERAYADIVALCQVLPGPSSSQAGMAIGLQRAGLPGMLAAWAGFTLPSALLMALFAGGAGPLTAMIGTGWLHGLKIAALAVVAGAVLGMGRQLAPDMPRALVALAAAALALLMPGLTGQLGGLAAGAVAGTLLFADEAAAARMHGRLPVGRGTGIAALALFAALLAGLPVLAAATQSPAIDLADIFYRAGALVFGGGHVVLPLLHADLVDAGWIGNDAFVAGYGAAQAVPGPLFTFSAYLGAVIQPAGHGVAGAATALAAIFAPSFLLVLGALPLWAGVLARPGAQAALKGVNAAVVGLLLAALYDPVWTSAVFGPLDAVAAAAAFLLLNHWRVPPWLVVGLCAATGGLVLSA